MKYLTGALQLIKLAWPGLKKIAEVQMIETVAQAKEAVNDLKIVSGLSDREILQQVKHELVKDCLLAIGEEFGWTEDEIDKTVPFLVVIYKKFSRIYKQQKKRRGK
jgi:16S rRNA U1498 N3-methylase RsmE